MWSVFNFHVSTLSYDPLLLNVECRLFRSNGRRFIQLTINVKYQLWAPGSLQWLPGTSHLTTNCIPMPLGFAPKMRAWTGWTPFGTFNKSLGVQQVYEWVFKMTEPEWNNWSNLVSLHVINRSFQRHRNTSADRVGLYRGHDYNSHLVLGLLDT